MSELTSAIIGVDVGLVILIIIQMFKPTPRWENPHDHRHDGSHDGRAGRMIDAEAT